MSRIPTLAPLCACLLLLVQAAPAFAADTPADYTPGLWEEVTYQQRKFFDWGGWLERRESDRGTAALARGHAPRARRSARELGRDGPRALRGHRRNAVPLAGTRGGQQPRLRDGDAHSNAKLYRVIARTVRWPCIICGAPAKS